MAGMVPAALFVIWFFRDPQRQPERADTALAMICPADGKVVEITEAQEADFIGGPARKMAIFMSVVDVHVNRAPCDSVVKWTRHEPGRFMNAIRGEAGLENERVLIALERPNGSPLLLKQVAGLIARRIVCPLKPGQRLAGGERFGMIKFGSRVEIFLPAGEKFDIAVRLGQRVVAGRTILGTWQ
jgi:phosphatidylserine decarboxylase